MLAEESVGGGGGTKGKNKQTNEADLVRGW